MKKIIIAILLILFFGSIALAASMQFSADTTSGYAYKQGYSYPPSGTTTWVTNEPNLNGQKFYGGGSGLHFVTTICFKFDTSGLPDNATITGASIYFYDNYANEYLDTGRNFNLEYYGGNVDGNCWTDSVGTDAFTGAVSNYTGYNNVTLTLTNTSTNISKTGYTTFRGGISGGACSGYNGYSQFRPHGGSDTTNRPVLTVTYTTGYSKKINGVTSAAKVNGVAVPTKVNGL